MSIIRNFRPIIIDWGLRCFGLDHMRDSGIRSLRFIEEAIELAQANGHDKAKIMAVVDAVYDRPAGHVEQEIGGVMVTLIAFCSSLNIDLEKALESEVLRVLWKSPEHFSKRNQEKIDLGLTP